jgi:hypothetical protein
LRLNLAADNLMGGGPEHDEADNHGAASADDEVMPEGVHPAPRSYSNDGVTWVIPIVQNGTDTTWSYTLGAASGGTGTTASLQDGVYHLAIATAGATTVPGGTPLASAYLSPMFHRLYGDSDGNKTSNTLDYARFKNAFGSSTGSSAYSADFDLDNNGSVNALDYAQFKKRFGLAFTYPAGF